MYSFHMILLIYWIMGLIIMNSMKENNLKLFINMMIILTFTMLMNFYTMNLLMFYFLFEISLILMFIIIMKWGTGFMRIIASYYLMFYTLIFSLPSLIIFLYIMNNLATETFLILETINSYNLSMIMFLYLISSFLVKFPMYLIHNWLLQAHVEASWSGSMILASIMLKLGSYGMMRLMLFLTKYFMIINNYIITISMLGSLIMSLNCLRQIDLKIIVAMSSVVHMNFMLAAMMTMKQISFNGSYLLMIAHGLCSSGLFYLVNICYYQSNSRLLMLNKCLLTTAPTLAFFWFLLTTSNSAAPISLNLVSEILLIISLTMWMKILIIPLFLYCILSFMYSINLMSKLIHGPMNYFSKFNNNKNIHNLTLLAHWIPLNLIFLNLNYLI